MKTQPLVSIIIPTKNSADVLEACLDSLKNQTFTNSETIVVDDFSSDGTKQIAEKYAVKFVQEFCNKPEARNIGINNSKGDYILILDSDMVLANKLVEELVRIFNREQPDAVYIPEQYKKKNGFWEKCRNIEKSLYTGIDFIESPRAYTKDVYEQVRFDEFNEGPDEYDYYLDAQKYIKKTSRINSTIMLLESPFNFKKKINHGKFFTYYKNKHQNLVKRQASPSRAMILFGAFKVAPLQGIGLCTLKLVEYLCFTFGRIKGYFDKRILRQVRTAENEFDSVGKNYEKEMYKGSVGNQFVDEYEKKCVLNLVKKNIYPTKNIAALDVGAGNGRWSREFQIVGMDVTALDVSEEMCNVLKKDKKIKVLNGNIENVYLKSGSFSFIFSFRSFKYVNKKNKALNNIRNALTPDGIFIVEMPNAHNLFYALPNFFSAFIFHITKGKSFKNFILCDFVTEKSFEDELAKNGLRLIEVKRMFFFPHKFYSIIQNAVILRILRKIDSAFERISPRSYIFVVKK